MKKIWALALLLMGGFAHAALIDRGEGFIYDDVLDITWAQNANVNGLDTWDNQVAWVDSYSQTHTVFGTFDDWRLPTTPQPDASCDLQFDPGGGFPLQGYGTGCTGSEMGHLFNVDGISSSSPGPFSNVQPALYWSGTAYEADLFDAWFFDFGIGEQSADNKGYFNYAWAVRSGDIAAVPLPAAVWLFASALLGLAGIRRGRRMNRFRACSRLCG